MALPPLNINSFQRLRFAESKIGEVVCRHTLDSILSAIRGINREYDPEARERDFMLASAVRFAMLYGLPGDFKKAGTPMPKEEMNLLLHLVRNTPLLIRSPEAKQCPPRARVQDIKMSQRVKPASFEAIVENHD